MVQSSDSVGDRPQSQSRANLGLGLCYRFRFANKL